MKKITIIPAAVLCMVAAVSCTAEIFVQDSIRRTTIDASITSTKTAFGEKDGTAWPNYWKAGDQISVNGVISNEVDSETDGKASATFTFEGELATPYYAAYPAAAVSSFNAGSATLTMPATQSYVAGSYDPAALLMLGASNESGLVTISPCVGVIRLSMSGEASISRIKLTGADDAALSGTFTTDFSSITAEAVSNVVELVAETPVALPADFFICVPAGLSGALKIEAFDINGGSMSKTANITSPLVPGKVFPTPVLPYAGAVNIAITAEGVTSSTAVICWDNVPTAAYTVGVYSDSACTSLLNSYAIPAGDACWSGKSPRFCISGLNAGITYYVKVTNVAYSTNSNILPVTTEAFKIVEVSNTPAEVDDVILAEDFSEFRWDCDLIGNGAGYFPASQDSFANAEPNTFQAAATSNEKQISAQGAAVAASRLAHWAQGANPHMYVHPGYIKLVGQKKVTHLVTPALDNIPEGKIATLEVKVTARAYYSESSGSFATTSAIVAVQPAGSCNELVDDTNTNTLDLSTNKQDITLTEETAWNEYTVTVSGVGKGARLAFGAASDVTGNDARMNISDIVVKIVGLKDKGAIDEIVEISDFSTFKSFLTACNSGKTIQGDVTADVDLTSAQLEEIDALYPVAEFGGIINGNNHTISGLAKPLIAQLTGKVNDLTLNSSLNITDASNNIGIIAATASNATISGCTTAGSACLAYDSEVTGSISIGGLVGLADNVAFTNCVNTAAVSNTSNASVGIFVGGLVGQSAGGTYVTCHNVGAVSNSGVAKDSKERADVAVAGLIGFLNGDVTLTGTASAYNYNNGPVSETSSSTYIAVSGVAGIIKGNCNLSFVKNLADGDLTVSGNTRNKVYMGGCVALVQRFFTMDDASNAGDLNFSGITIANNSTSNVIAGGVIGSFSESASDTVEQNSETVTVQDAEFTFRRLTNSGKINCPNSSSGANMAAAGKSSKAFSYFGGIAGVGNNFSKNFYNCTNTGAIAVYNQLKTRIGGILGYSNRNPTGCVNTGPINYCRYNGQSNGGNGEVGGVVGYMNIETPEDLTNDATVRTTGSTPNCYTGGIIGRTNSTTVGFKNCYVGSSTGTQKTISAPGEGTFENAGRAGLFSADGNSGHAWDFTGCKIKNGTKCQNVEVTSSNLQDAVIGRNKATSITNEPAFVDSF